ncbi:LAMI_0D05732g1_1 [Lachancea mirantina]|uniref:LAMI_0D05732g1_1 n=1 Tax=Lachancea mirantina TaxID=1230905 RepID=A0A1G4JB83_9SACH|nr:LAMI_0D05732g1_1 [Lachancea mirantina]
MVKKKQNPLKIDFEKCVIEDKLLQIRKETDSTEPYLVKVWAIEINARSSKALIEFLRDDVQEKDPVSFLHLKRIKKSHRSGYLTVLVCSFELINEEVDFDELMANVKFDYLKLDEPIWVPIQGPGTKKLFMEWSAKYWPLIWRGNPNDQELNSYTFDMDKIKSVLQNITEKSRSLAANNHSKIPVVSAFVNPVDGEEIYMSDGREDGSELSHSCMRAIRQVAEQEQERRENALKTSGETETYLCLNFDVYTTHEPCSMCAMALIHSRIKRCIFIESMGKSGSLRPDSGDGYCIHDNRRLNSKYEVFQWIGDEFELPEIEPRVCC